MENHEKKKNNKKKSQKTWRNMERQEIYEKL